MIYPSSLLAYDIKIKKFERTGSSSFKVKFRSDSPVWSVTDRPQRESSEFPFSALTNIDTWKRAFDDIKQYSIIAGTRRGATVAAAIARPRVLGGGVYYKSTIESTDPEKLAKILSSRSLSIFTSPIDDSVSSDKTAKALSEQANKASLGLDFLARFKAPLNLSTDESEGLVLTGLNPKNFLFYAPGQHESLDRLTGIYDFETFASEEGWANLFGSIPPNALLTSPDITGRGGKPGAFDFVLSQPTLDPVTGSWTARIDPIGLTSQDLQRLVKRIGKQEISIEDAIMYIDSTNAVSGSADLNILSSACSNLIQALQNNPSADGSKICGDISGTLALLGGISGVLAGAISGGATGGTGGAALGLIAGVLIGHIADVTGVPEVVGAVGLGLGGLAYGGVTGAAIFGVAGATILGASSLSICSNIVAVKNGSETAEQAFQNIWKDSESILDLSSYATNKIEEQVTSVADTFVHVFNDIKHLFW